MFSTVVPFSLVDDACKVLIPEQLCQTPDKKLENLLPRIQNHYQFGLRGLCNQGIVSYKENCEKQRTPESDLVLISSAKINADL
jgi:hypothetical protein